MPLLSDRVRDQTPWIQLSIESVLVVLSVLLALALNAWYDHSQEQEKVERALRSLYAELTETQSALENRIPYHAALIDTMRSDDLSFQAPLALQFAVPNDEAWQTAQQTGTVGLMSYELARPISNAYAVASDLEFLFRNSYSLLFDGPNYLGADPEQVRGFWGYLNDYKNLEVRLLDRVNRALSAIEAEHPALKSSSGPTAPS
jgi:type II secretory pathway pseudopilin PulG